MCLSTVISMNQLCWCWREAWGLVRWQPSKFKAAQTQKDISVLLQHFSIRGLRVSQLVKRGLGKLFWSCVFINKHIALTKTLHLFQKVHPASLTSCLLLHKNFFAAFWDSAHCWVFSLLLPLCYWRQTRNIQSASTPKHSVICRFLTLHRKEFKSEFRWKQMQVLFRWREKRPEHRFLETGSGGKPRTRCDHPLLSWLQVSQGTSVKETKVHV